MQTTSSLIFSSDIASLEIYCNGRNIPARKSPDMSGDLHGFYMYILHVLARKRRISTFFFSVRVFSLFHANLSSAFARIWLFNCTGTCVLWLFHLRITSCKIFRHFLSAASFQLPHIFKSLLLSVSIQLTSIVLKSVTIILMWSTPAGYEELQGNIGQSEMDFCE